MTTDDRLKELGIELPDPIQPAGSYVRSYRTGNLLYISGTGPTDRSPKGKVGADVSLEDARQAARDIGLQLLATAKEALDGDLDRITHAVKVLGMVNTAPDFLDHPQVINGCSDVLVEVLGERGRHTRSAIGFAALPHDICVEIEATFEIT